MYHHLDKDDRLRRRYLKAFAAANITADEHIVHPDHIIAGIIEPGTVLFAEAAWRLLLFRPLHPSDLVLVALAAIRAREARLLDFLSFVENIAFVHLFGVPALAGDLLGAN